MKLSHYEKNGACVVVVEGDIISETVEQVEKYIEPFLTNQSIKALILNGEKIDYIDSSGLGFFVKIFKKLKEEERSFALCDLEMEVREMFGMANLDKFLNIYSTEHEALNSF
ncbi:MAG: STAS domain-containing protein [SAR324 cluster bacterium]|nr:STAS domain-containing protein [SAR324 cluster bacterium]